MKALGGTGGGVGSRAFQPEGGCEKVLRREYVACAKKSKGLA